MSRRREGRAARSGSPPSGAVVPATRASALLCALPDRLLLSLFWTGVVVLTSAVVGQHRPAVVVPATIATLAATWRWQPLRRAASRRHPLAVLACLLLLAAWVGVQLPLTGERLLINRDPDVYTLTALWLVDEPGLAIPVPSGSDGTLGFDLEGGAWRPQGNHLVPAMSAALGWVGGEPAVFASPLVWGAFGLLALFTLGSRVVGPGWALVPVLALALSLPMVDASRSLYTEPMALALTLLGGALLLDAWRSRRPSDVVLAGAVLGSVSLARVDGLVGLVGVVAGLTPLALSVRGASAATALRWGSPLVATAAAPLVALSVGDLAAFSGVYFDNLRGQILALVTVTAVAALATAGLAAADAVLPIASWRRGLRRVAPHLGLALLVAFGVLASRPAWLVSRATEPNPLVAALQEAEGLPVDGARTYAEHTVTWLVWYAGPAAVGLGLTALCLWLAVGLRDPRRSHVTCLLLLVLPSTVLYLVDPAITPDQVWSVRRFLPVVLPGLLLGAAWLLRALVRRGRDRSGLPRAVARVAAALLAAATVAWPAATLPGLWGVRDEGGSRAGVEAVCELLAGRPTVVTGVDTLAPTVRVVCGVPTFALVEPDPTAVDLARARRALGGGDVALVTRDPAPLPWHGDAPEPQRIVYSRWEASLLRRPAGAARTVELLAVGQVDAAGRLRGG